MAQPLLTEYCSVDGCRVASNVTGSCAGPTSSIAVIAKYSTDVARLSTDIYLTDHLPAMTPTEAFSHIARRKTERVPIDELEGRITTSLVTPYPPGIPLLIPGEKFNAKIVDYLRFNREFARECPGFETDIHGLVLEAGPDGVVHHYADCVAS